MCTLYDMPLQFPPTRSSVHPPSETAEPIRSLLRDKVKQGIAGQWEWISIDQNHSLGWFGTGRKSSDIVQIAWCMLLFCQFNSL